MILEQNEAIFVCCLSFSVLCCVVLRCVVLCCVVLCIEYHFRIISGEQHRIG